jgi:hypothetical protein
MTATTTTTGSAIVAALESAWASIGERVSDLPEVVFITGTGLMGRGAKWGHYRGHGWALRAVCPEGCLDHAHDGDSALVVFHEGGRKPEVFIAGERLATGAANTLQTMLHEGAHALAAARGQKDTSKEGRYHNGTFLTIAEELGLEYLGTPDKTIGYSGVTLTEAAREEYADVIADLDAAIAVYLDTFQGLGLVATGSGTSGNGDGENGGKVAGKGGKKSRNNPRALCSCPTPRLIRASRKVLEEAPIVCGLCESAFRIEEDEEA